MRLCSKLSSLQDIILYRVGGTCGGLQSMPPNYLTILLLPITTPVLQSLHYTEYRAVCRRPFSLEDNLELTYLLPLLIW
jgi:hypothetical protein